MDCNISATLSGHQRSPTNNYVLNGKIMVGTVILLFFAIAVFVGFHTYAKWFFNRRRRAPRHLFFFSSSSGNTTSASSNSSGTNNQALDVRVLKTIPTFVYSSTTPHNQLLECAVCLSEFEKNEKGRLLPRCSHAFHVDCIDMWFQSHSNCPICRAPVQPGIPVQPPAILVTEAGSVTEPAGSGNEREEAKVGCSSHTSQHLDNVSVVVEMPRGK